MSEMTKYLYAGIVQKYTFMPSRSGRKLRKLTFQIYAASLLGPHPLQSLVGPMNGNHCLSGCNLLLKEWSSLFLSSSQTFLAYTDAGASFVFGEKYTDHFFAFKVKPKTRYIPVGHVVGE